MYNLYMNQEEENVKKKFATANDLSGCVVRRPTSRTERYSSTVKSNN